MTSVTVLPSGDVSGAELVWTIVVAGGTGERFGNPKQYELLDDRRVIDHSRSIAERASAGVVVVVPAADVDRERGVAGGSSRSESVRAGLAAVPTEATIICVHDAARPLATLDLYQRVISAVSDGAEGAIPAIEVTDTIKVVDRCADGGIDGAAVVSTPDRSTLVAVQTPQAFRASALRAAHGQAGSATDDAALVEAFGGRVVVVAGERRNRKITEPDDLDWARRALTSGGTG
jgi:2-C-methyl-D-erythritol 4-phosphate cytidylyltransferase